MKKSLSVLFLFLMTQFVWAQDKCAAHIFEQQLRAKYPQLGTVQGFEAWMAQKINERRSNPNARSGPYKIAVIIHVIHDGSAIANGSQNIPYAQAISQVRVLNEDFHRTNPDASSTRAVFSAHLGSMPDLEFVLATKDPNGNVLPEPGVERINGVTKFGVSAWSGPGGNSDTQLKPNTIWDPTKYLNLWCVNFSSSGLFGYAQFPEGSTLPGMPAAGAANTDGVVINFKSMGSNYTSTGASAPGGPFITNPIAAGTDRGRTTTHEIGHWLGLRHIWGDSEAGCSNANSNDYCTDTPFVTGDAPLTSNCATSQARNTCTTLEPDYSNTDAPDQIENYMDYSADVCMNMFSADQATRMYTVMENSPRRNTLTAAAATVAAPVLTGAYPYITASKTTITEGDQVSFSGSGRMGDNETPNTISTWTWNFDVDGLGGASPATSTSQNPGNVTFSKAGTYKVRLTISNGTTSGAITVNIISGLKSPSNLQFTNKEGTGSNVKVIDKANLQWNDNSGSEDNYTVERKKNSDPISSYAVIATLPANTTTYSDVFGSSNAVESGVTYNYRVSAKKGTEVGSVTGSIRVELTTAFEDEFSKEVRLYPNPAQKGFTIDLKNIQTQKAQTQLYNSVGQLVGEKSIENGQLEYNVEGMAKGMYILKIQTDKGVAIKRLVIN
jgi:zinc-dependent metalloproteinase lipoprotein